MLNLQVKKIVQFASVVIIGLFVSFLLSLSGFSNLSATKDSQYLNVLNEVWQEVNDNFFDPNFNGVDWAATREEYEERVKQAQTLEQASVVINQMLSELKTSHTHFYTQLEPAYYQLLGIFSGRSKNDEIKKVFPDGKLDYPGIGIFTQDIKEKTFVRAILDGSPAAEAGLKVGDAVLTVDGKPYQPIQSFIDKTDREVQLSIQRTPDGENLEEITVVPKRLNPNTMFLEAIK